MIYVLLRNTRKRLYDNPALSSGLRIFRAVLPDVLLVYAFIFSPVVEMSIEERFFMNVISLSTLYMVVFTLLMFRVFIKDSGIRMARDCFKVNPTTMRDIP